MREGTTTIPQDNQNFQLFWLHGKELCTTFEEIVTLRQNFYSKKNILMKNRAPCVMATNLLLVPLVQYGVSFLTYCSPPGGFHGSLFRSHGPHKHPSCTYKYLILAVNWSHWALTCDPHQWVSTLVERMGSLIFFLGRNGPNGSLPAGGHVPCHGWIQEFSWVSVSNFFSKSRCLGIPIAHHFCAAQLAWSPL